MTVLHKSKIEPILRTLAEMSERPKITLFSRGSITAFPHYWQIPAATEKAAFESMLNHSNDFRFDYYGFPWATIIDGVRGSSAKASEVLSALHLASKCSETGNRRRVTVAQHIHALKYIDLFKASGITDLFWSHTTRQQTEIQGIRLHPFPLFPAQTPNGLEAGSLSRPRQYLTNFIGAYNPAIYLSNVRQHIFNDADRWPDVLIIKRDAWHFDRAVYDEQISGKSASKQHKQVERRRTEEYLDAIKNSWFTLCPTGSGPNSIRIFESLCLGSIPIILTRDLALPGPKSLWGAATIIEEDSEAGYSKAMEKVRSMNIDQKYEMIRYGCKLFNFLKPESYAELIENAMFTAP